MSTEQSIIGELETALTSGSPDKSVETLRRVTDLFILDADRFNDREVDVFNGVLEHLVKRIEGKALAEFSQRLGPVKNAPPGVVRQLANNEDIAIAGPVLTQSARLTDKDLVEIAQNKTQAHLLAISGRSEIDKSVTDVLLQRGNNHVFHKLAENQGADFSKDGFATLVRRSERDEQLAEKVGLRHDIPLPMFQELLKRATEVVRQRLLSTAAPEARDHIQIAVASISDDERAQASSQNDRDFAEAHARMLALQNNGRLSESTILECARSDRYADAIAALSLLSDAPMQLIEDLLQSKHREGFLIPCKVAGLRWAGVSIMMNYRASGGILSGREHDTLRADYQKLSEAAATKALRFWHVRQTPSKAAAVVTKSPPTSPAEAPGSHLSSERVTLRPARDN
jgi:uncharacterized protein (DUF2336 family)